MKNPIYELKEIQKNLAEKIRKSDEKNYRFSFEYRHNHIAYCEIRGRERFQIEKPAKGNEPCEYTIDRIKKVWLDRINKWREDKMKDGV